MAYPQNRVSITCVGAAAGFPICGGCGTLLPPRPSGGGPARKWCSETCRMHGRRRKFPFELRWRHADQLIQESIAALRLHARSEDTRQQTIAVNLLLLAGGDTQTCSIVSGSVGP